MTNPPVWASENIFSLKDCWPRVLVSMVIPLLYLPVTKEGLNGKVGLEKSVSASWLSLLSISSLILQYAHDSPYIAWFSSMPDVLLRLPVSWCWVSWVFPRFTLTAFSICHSDGKDAASPFLRGVSSYFQDNLKIALPLHRRVWEWHFLFNLTELLARRNTSTKCPGLGRLD